MKYDVIFSNNSKDFQKAIQDWIDDGWEPQGGVAMQFNQYSKFYWAQAMVKKNKRKKSSR